MTRTLPFALLLFACALAASADTFTVSREDDGPGTGTLRWAIEEANATPGVDTISFLTSVKTIAVVAPLPPMTEALKLQAFVTIDGTSAGAADGLVLAADHVELRYVTVQNFSGDAIVVRGSLNVLEFVTARRSTNGIRVEGSGNNIYGCVFGGDAWAASSTAGNRGAGVWLTASASGNMVGRYVPPCQILCPPLGGGNSIAFNGGPGIIVDGPSNTLDSNVVYSNAGHGIVVRGAKTAVHNEDVSFNGGDGMHLYTVIDADDRNKGTCNGGALIAGDHIELPPAPRITLAVDDATAVTVSGEIDGTPGTTYAVQAMALPDACDGSQPARRIGAVTLTTDNHGHGFFRIVTGKWDEINSLTLGLVAVTARVASSSPSGLSALSPAVGAGINHDHRADLAVSTTGPATTTTGVTVTFDTVVTNNGPASISGAKLEIPALPGAELVSVTAEKANCYLDGLHYCTLDALAPGDRAIIRHTVRFRAPGAFGYSATASLWSSADSDANGGNNFGQVFVRVEPATTSRRRAVGH